MKFLILAAVAIAAFGPQIAAAGAYKCTVNGKTVYQASPCDVEDPEANKLNIRRQTEEQKARAAERLQQVRSEDEARISEREKAEKEAYEDRIKFGTLQTMRENTAAQQRQADALEEEAKKPPVMLIFQ